MGSEEDYRPELLCVVNHFLHLPSWKHPHGTRTRRWMSEGDTPQRQELTRQFVNMASKMKPLALAWTRLSIILNIRWQEMQNKGYSGASSVQAVWRSISFAKEALHIKEHLPNSNLPFTILGS